MLIRFKALGLTQIKKKQLLAEIASITILDSVYTNSLILTREARETL
jgi:hypothetical protein